MYERMFIYAFGYVSFCMCVGGYGIMVSKLIDVIYPDLEYSTAGLSLGGRNKMYCTEKLPNFQEKCRFFIGGKFLLLT